MTSSQSTTASPSTAMVSKTEEAQLNKLESQVDNGGGGAWEYLCLVRKLKVRRSKKVLKYCMLILNDLSKRSSLGPEGRTETFEGNHTMMALGSVRSMFLEEANLTDQMWEHLIKGCPNLKDLELQNGMVELNMRIRSYSFKKLKFGYFYVKSFFTAMKQQTRP